MSNEDATLSSRWATNGGKELAQTILRLLRKGKSSAIPQVAGMHEGRSDLRGFLFPKPMQTGQSVRLRGYEVELVSGALEFERILVKDIDFSHASLTETIWRRCSFSNCKFDHSDLGDAAFFDCHISSCVFVNSNLTGCVLGGHLRRRSGELMDSEFNGGKFKDVVFAFPKIERCIFDCDITNVDFNGSQIVDCKFAGKLDRVIFRRRPSESVTEEMRLTRLIPENRMDHVDLSEAHLHDVDFWNGVDLTKCIFPKNKHGLFLVLDGPVVFVELKKEIESSWNGEERRIGLGYTDNYYLDRIKDGQRHFLIDEESFIEDWGESLGHRYATLIREVARCLGAVKEVGGASQSFF